MNLTPLIPLSALQSGGKKTDLKAPLSEGVGETTVWWGRFENGGFMSYFTS